MLVTQFDKFVNRSTQEVLGGEIVHENLEPMLSTDIVRNGSNVTGVKGEKEVYYRTGNVNLTPADIGALDDNNIYNGLDKTVEGYALDARQGKALADDIAGKMDKANIYNGLDETIEGYALDARQGKVLADKFNATQSGLAIIVDGDTASMAVPVGGYAYIKNNTHGLDDGLYTNTSSGAFPTSGGTANSTVFTAVSGGGLNDVISTHTAGTTVKCRRVGSVVSLTIGSTVTIGADGVFYTIDESFRPLENTYFFVTYGSLTAGNPYLAVVKPNGDVVVYNRGDSLDYLFGSVTYIK